MNKIKKSVQSGFTLIELIAVMVILGILAAVIIPAIGSLTAGAYQSNAQTMYGAIKNAVNNQAVKASMTGNRMKQFPVASSSTLNAYLDAWIEDYDSQYWVQWQFDNLVGNAVATDNEAAAAIFGYFPHGIPAAVSNAGASVDLTGKGGDAVNTSQEDVYYIVYSPITTLDGADGGVQYDGYTLCLWYDDDQDHTFEGDITVASNGTVTYDTDPDTHPSAEYVHTSIKAAD